MGTTVFVRIFKPDDPDYVLMVHNHKKRLPNGEIKEEGWGLPGGGVRNGEGLNEACHRELREETGLAAEISEEIFFELAEKKNTDHPVMFFEGRSPTGEAIPDDKDIVEAEWVYWKWLQVAPGMDLHKNLPVYHSHIKAIHHGKSVGYKSAETTKTA